MKNIFLFLSVMLLMSGCKLMPYQSDFDCKIPVGQKCKSLYEINKMADAGAFDPELQNNKEKVIICRSSSKVCKVRSIKRSRTY
ncbi:MAG TPA: conjugal transfer protein TraV [Rickettsia endosymbiont of Omalisus fontisbellaquei]|nr:conjugal transfer protein TraV [Rickettsia endosymbiont of Omalisus fontisbellaquei]